MQRYIFIALLFASFSLSAQGNLSWSGIINDASGETLGNITVSLLDDGGSVVATQNVDCDGVFQLEGLEGDTDYTISIERDGNDLNGVSTLDLVLMSRHLLGVQSLNGPYALHAADVNADGSLSVLDMVLTRAVILAVLQEFPNGGWDFVEAGTTTSVVGTTLNLADSVSGVALVGVKRGDVNNTTVPCE